MSAGAFSFFQNFDFLSCQEGQRAKMAQNDKKLCHTLYLKKCRSYHQDSWYTGVKQQVFFIIFLKKCNIVNIKILTFFIGPLQQFFNKQLFFKFINKCQTEILRCAPPSSHVHNFLTLVLLLTFECLICLLKIAFVFSSFTIVLLLSLLLQMSSFVFIYNQKKSNILHITSRQCFAGNILAQLILH